MSLDIDAFNELIESHGAVFEHFKAVPCPLGLVDRDFARAPDHGAHACSFGYIYVPSGAVKAVFTGNSKVKGFAEGGTNTDGTAVLTVETRYQPPCDQTEVIVTPFDRLYPAKECEMRTVSSELVEYNGTGIDRTNFPVVAVEYLIDAQGVVYGSGDFEITPEGWLKWGVAKRPKYDYRLSKGTVYAIRYQHLSYWYITRLLHDTRVGSSEDYMGSERVLRRLPQEVQVVREKVFQAQYNGANNALVPRSVLTPRSANFGPR